MSNTAKPYKVRLAITSERYEIAGSLFRDIYGDEPDVALTPATSAEEILMGILADDLSDEDEDDFIPGVDDFFVKPADPAVLRAKQEHRETDAIEKIDLFTEGTMSILPDTDGDASTVVIRYDETELTGMAGATSTITYRTDDRGLVTMLRSGMVKTALTFRARHRAICTYDTPYMPFQIGIHALVVDNRLDTEGKLTLDYLIEIKGGCAERCTMYVTVTPATRVVIG